MSNNVKKNLIDTLNNLLNNNVSNNINDQVGGKRYSQKEVDDMLMASLFNIMTLYQKSVSDTKMIKNQIQQLLQQRSGVQMGGSKSYSRAEVDSVMTNSLQQIMSLYMQSENERHLLTKQLQQLQMGGVAASNVVSAIKSGAIHSIGMPPAKVFTKASIKAVQDYLDKLMNGYYGIGGNYTNNLCKVGMFKLLILDNLKSVPTDSDKSPYGLEGLKVMTPNSPNDTEIYIEYNNANKKAIEELRKIFEDEDGNTAGTKNTLSSQVLINSSSNNFQYNFGLKTGSKMWKPTANALNLIKAKIELKNDPTNDTTEFDLSSNDRFIEQLDGKYKSTGTEDIESYKGNDDIKTLIQFIRGHLIEQMGKPGGIVLDLP